MVQVNEELTKKIADLARVELSDTEVVDYTKQLQQIVGYVELINEVDVSAVEPMVQPHVRETPLREDRVNEPFVDESGRPKTLSPAPETVYDGFKVPPIL